jgi:hypothetical protein
VQEQKNTLISVENVSSTYVFLNFAQNYLNAQRMVYPIGKNITQKGIFNACPGGNDADSLFEG